MEHVYILTFRLASFALTILRHIRKEGKGAGGIYLVGMPHNLTNLIPL